MRAKVSREVLLIAVFGTAVCWGCSTSSGGDDNSGGATDSGGSSSVSGGSGGGPASSGGASTTGPTSSGGETASGGAPGSGGAVSTGGSQQTGGSATGGASTGTGGRGRGGANPGTGGRGGASPGTGGTATGGTATGGAMTGGTTGQGGATSTGSDCTIGAWPAADPAVTGPFTVTTEEEVGPEAGEAEDGGPIPRFTMFRPQDMAQSGLCHPVITWGNGTGSTPTMYGGMLKHFASHGFVVIGSNSKNVARGDPKPMLVGVTWVLGQNEDPASALYHRIDTTHIGATGHSQGAMATSQACGDEHITTCLPIEGASAVRNLHGPAMFFCGGQDTLVGCSGAESALAAVTDLPAMYANLLAVDHGSWMSFGGNKRSDAEITFTAWMRVHLMGDDSLKSWFYGADCKLCTDSAWQIDRKNMDQ